MKFSVRNAQDSYGENAICEGKFGNNKMQLRPFVRETTVLRILPSINLSSPSPRGDTNQRVSNLYFSMFAFKSPEKR